MGNRNDETKDIRKISELHLAAIGMVMSSEGDMAQDNAKVFILKYYQMGRI